MLPVVCSAALSCSAQFPISFPVGARTCSLLWSTDERHNVEDRIFLGNQDGVHRHEFFKSHATRYSNSLTLVTPDCGSSIDSSIFSPYPNGFDDIVLGFSNETSENEPENWSCFSKEVNVSYQFDAVASNGEIPLDFDPADLSVSNGDSGLSNQSIIEQSLISQSIELQNPGADAIMTIQEASSDAATVLSEPATTEHPLVSGPNMDIITGNTVSVSDILEATRGEVSKVKENVELLLDGLAGSTTTSISKAQTAFEDAYGILVSSVTKALDNLTGSLDKAFGSLFPSVEMSKEQADDKLTILFSSIRDSLYGAGGLATDIVRKAVVSFEGILSKATTYVVYSYYSSKTLLPAEVKDIINMTETKILEIFMPIGDLFQKAYVVIGGLEKSLGFDPDDPLVQLTFVFITSTTLGLSYWIIKYGGYSGDLSPESTLELLKNDDAVLIDVRPEDLRERDGVPDLRRRARFRYASIDIPEVDHSARKLLRSVRDVNYALTAAIIRNLKIVQDGTKIVVLDNCGDQSKYIARNLRTLGIKNSYLVQGGFRSWVQSGLRIKELKPETTLTILNEEAQAIIEDINPTPLQIFGYSVGTAAAFYALLEWEKTLQLIGVLGLGQTLYKRIASYKSSDDLKGDIRLLLGPLRLGARAVSWATGGLEAGKLGLATSPSSTAVRDRVLQAAAKHESQPSDSEELQNAPVEPATRGLDVSGA